MKLAIVSFLRPIQWTHAKKTKSAAVKIVFFELDAQKMHFESVKNTKERWNNWKFKVIPPE